jgi:hypothetical protein
VGFTPGQSFGGIRVDLGSVQFGLVDAAGVAWRVGADGLQGWDSAEVRTQLSDREADHGSWMGPVYLGSRPVTLAGTVVAPDAAALDSAIDRLLAACPVTDTVLTVWETTPKRSVVRRSGKPIVKRETDSIATYSLMVTAADPRRYGTTLQAPAAVHLPLVTGGLTTPLAPPLTINTTTVSGQITARNRGSFATRPVFTITGPVTAPQIVTHYPDGSLRTLFYNTDLVAGDSLALDTDARTAVLNGAVSRRRYVSGQWPEIPADSTVTFSFRGGYNPTATLGATWRSAWI